MAKIPHSGLFHDGVPLFGEQSAAPVQKARDDIDAVSLMSDIDDLVQVCRDRSWAAESRLWAFARLQAQWQQATDERRIRPDVVLEDVEACIAHLNTEWHSIIERSFAAPADEDGDD